MKIHSKLRAFLSGTSCIFFAQASLTTRSSALEWTWDGDITGTGIQNGNQNWATSATRWTLDGGDTHSNWPGSGDDNDARVTTGSNILNVNSNLRLDDFTTTNSNGNNTVRGLTSTIRTITLTGGTYNGTGTTGSRFSVSQGTLTLNATNDANAINNPILAGSADLVKLGNGTIHIQWTTPSFTGGIHILAGQVQINGNGSLGNAANGIYLNGGTLYQNTGADITLTSGRTIFLGPSTGSGNGTLRGGLAGFVIAGAIANNGTGTGNLVWNSSGRNLTLNGDNSFSGTTSVTGAGKVLINHANALGNSTVLVTSGSFSFGATNATTLTAASFGGLSGSDNLTLENINTIPAPVALTVGANHGNTTYSGILSGMGSLAKNGTGTLKLTNTNTYAGNTTITGGLIEFSTLDNFGPTGSIMLDGGGLRWATGNTIDVTLSPRLAALGAGGGVFDTNGNDITLAGDISGSGSLTKAGAGTLVLSGTNSYAGNTIITGGLVEFDSLDNFSTGNITLSGGGLRWTTGNTIDVSARLTALGSGGGVLDTNGNDVTFATAISGPGPITKNGTGVLTLNTANTFTGATTVTAGQIVLKDSNALGSGTVATIANGLVFDSSVIANAFTLGGLSGSGDLALLNNAGSPASVDLAVGGNGESTSYTGILSGGGSLTKNGAGTLALSGINTYSGNTFINAGVIEFNSLDSFGTGTVTVIGGGLRWAAGTSADISSRLAPLGAGGVIFDTNGNSPVLASGLSGTGPFTKIGAGTLTLNGSNSHSGITTILGGVLSIDSASRLGTSGTVVLDGGTLQSTASFTLGGISVGSSGGSFSPDAATTLTISTAISGTGNLTLVGAGNVSLGAANSFSGTTSVTGTGKLVLMHTDALAASTVTTGSAGLEFDASVISNSFNFGGLSGSANLTLENNSLTPAAVTLGIGGNNANTTYAGVLSGTGSVIKSGSGQLNFNGINTYSGKTTIQQGTLEITADSGLGTPPTSPVADSLTLDGGTLTTRLVGGSFTIDPNRGITLGTNGGTWSTTTPAGAWTVTFNGVITGPGSLTKTFGQTLQLGGDNTFTGGIMITAGTVRIGHPGALNATNPNTVGFTGGSSLALNGNNITIASLSGAAGNVQNANASAATLTVNQATSSSFTGTLTDGTGGGNLSLTKTGAGTLTLGGINTFTGNTNIANGGLTVTGSMASDIVVESNGTFSAGSSGTGSGTVGALSFASGGTLEVALAGTFSQIPQVETATASGTAAANGDVLVTVTGGGITGSPINIAVPILESETADVWAGKVRTAIGGNPAITALYTVGGTADSIVLTRNEAAANDPTLNIALANDTTSPGIIAAPSSADTTAGADITSPTAQKTIATGPVEIAGAILDVTSAPATPLADGIKFTILDYSGQSLSGTFAGLPNGGTIVVGPNTYTIDYNDDVVANTVTLTSGLVTVSDPFGDWAQTNITAINNAAPAGFSDDADGDGLDNGLEWILGGDPLSGELTEVLPVTTGSAAGGLTLVFNRNEDAIGKSTLSVEWNTDLGAWNNSVVIGTTDIPANGIQPTVDIDAPSPGKVTVNIPAANAAGGTIFARLQATDAAP